MFFASSFLLFGQEDALPAADAGAVAFLGGTTPVLLFMLLTRRARGSLLRTRGLAMRIGAIEALGLFSAVAALRHGPLVVAAIVLGLFAPASAVMGLVWLRERLSILQVFGVLATIIAVMAFAL
jgi:drug/metabolite transporter (DMT)-like permease